MSLRDEKDEKYLYKVYLWI